MARRDIRIRARGVDVARVLQRHHRAGDRHRRTQRRHVEHLEALPVGNERIPELDRDAARIVQMRCADLGGDLRRRRIVDVDDNEPTRREDVHVVPGEDDAPRACEHAVRIERERPRQEVVRRVAVEQRCRADEDEPSSRVGHVEVAVQRMDRSVPRSPAVASASGRRRASSASRRRRRTSFSRRNAAQRRHRGGDDPLGETLVVDEGDVVDAEAARPERDVQVFAAHLDVERVRAGW